MRTAFSWSIAILTLVCLPAIMFAGPGKGISKKKPSLSKRQGVQGTVEQIIQGGAAPAKGGNGTTPPTTVANALIEVRRFSEQADAGKSTPDKKEILSRPVFRTATTDDKGRFKIFLSPGRYAINARIKNSYGDRTTEPAIVLVTSAHFTALQIVDSVELP